MNIMGIKDLTNIPLTEPVEQIIEVDGGFACCMRCRNEITPKDSICPRCKQVQDWSWFGKYKKEEN